MVGPWRPLVVAAVLCVTTLAGRAEAQTIIVKKTAGGTTVDAVFNAATVTATADPTGIARLALNAVSGTDEASVRIFFDTCDARRRVVLTGRDIEPPRADTSCARREISGVFVIRRGTTLVLDASETIPTVLISQGPVPPEWLMEGSLADLTVRYAPTGIMAFGGGGFSQIGRVVESFCGTGAACSGSEFQPSFSAGVTYWLTNFLAGEVGYGTSTDLTVRGSGTNYGFESTLDTEVVMVVAKTGFTARHVRPYFQAGSAWHRSTSRTRQTVEDRIISVDGVNETVPGGVHTISFRTEGWGWLFGGGVEVWTSDRVGVFLDGRVVKLNGRDVAGGEGLIDKKLNSFQFGLRFNLTP